MEGTPSGAKSLFLGRRSSYRICSAILTIAMFGCGNHSGSPYPTFASRPDASPAFLVENSNAYSDYLAAAHELDLALGKNSNLLTKSSFSPGEQATIERAASQPLRRLKIPLQKVCRIPYSPPHSQGATVGRSEWRLLGRVLVWRIQDACGKKGYGSAIESAVMATKFGFDLSAGLPDDASLGLLSVDDARRAIAPSLSNMNIGQLETLSRAMKTVYQGRPAMTLCYDYAEKDSLEEIQEIQETYRTESYPELERKIGSEAKEVTPILKELHQQSDQKRVAFFDGLVQDAKNETEKLKEDASLPLAARAAPTPPKPGIERPWRKLSRRLLGIGTPIEKMNDATSAKTQLLILECQILRILKMNGRTPVDLRRFSVKLVSDPYSGQPFVYRTDGTDYKLYSVGDDLIDNDGESDESYNRPDMRLEKPQQ